MAASTSGTLVKKEALPRLQNLLNPMVSSWNLFVQQIGVPADKIDQIKAANAQIGPNWLSTCLNEALDWWVDNHDSPTYEVIIAVLDPKKGETTPVMNRALARKVREFMAGEQVPQRAMEHHHQATATDEKAIKRDEKPSLVTLKKFPGKSGNFNVLKRIGTDYTDLGTHLLQDDDGTKVSAIATAKQLNPALICEEIVKQWLKGEGKQPVTYATLVECLKDAELNELAKDMEKVLQ